MKKILSLLVLLVTFASCEEDVKFNNPAVQGVKNDELWKAAQFTAVLGGDGSLTITGTNGFETLTLRTASTNPGLYELGVNNSSMASFIVNVEGVEMAYQTGTGIGDGVIEISDDIRETDLNQGFISGTFTFNAVGEDGTIVNFRDGVFFKVPITAIQ